MERHIHGMEAHLFDRADTWLDPLRTIIIDFKHVIRNNLTKREILKINF